MYDRPTVAELLEAARNHFEEKIVPLARQNNHQLYFQTLVAINVMKIAEREIEKRPTHLRNERARLGSFFDNAMPDGGDDVLAEAIEAANAELCERIRAGDFDDNQQLFEHLMAGTIEQLEVANPKFLKALAIEDEMA